jgi:adenylate kinase family enzyme
MKVLITGTSGSGKSTVGKKLKTRGFDVIETDTEVFDGLSIAYWKNKDTGKGIDMPWPPPKNWHHENDWVWRVDVLSPRLQSSGKNLVFACGDSRNKQDAFKLFDKIILLKTDDETLRQRISSRKDNYFGKTEHELRWILSQNQIIIKEMKEAGAVFVDATQTLDKVVSDILRLVRN